MGKRVNSNMCGGVHVCVSSEVTENLNSATLNINGLWRACFGVFRFACFRFTLLNNEPIEVAYVYSDQRLCIYTRIRIYVCGLRTRFDKHERFGSPIIRRNTKDFVFGIRV